MSEKRNIMWGLICLAAAALLITGKLGYLGEVGIWSLICTVILIPICISSMIRLNFAGIFFPIAIIGILYAKPLGIESLTPWPILAAALLLTMGLSFLFPGRHRRSAGRHKQANGGAVVIDEPDESEVNLETRMGGSVKYINTDRLRSVNIVCSFGGLEVFFDHAKLENGQAVINLDVNFGGVTLYFPKNWKMINHVDCMFGAVEEKGKYAEATDQVVTIEGKARFAGVEILYL